MINLCYFSEKILLVSQAETFKIHMHMYKEAILFGKMTQFLLFSFTSKTKLHVYNLLF